MKTIKGTLRSLPVIIAALTVSASVGHAQNPLVITSVTAAPDKAVQLRWQSESNAVYSIEFASELIDASLGGPAWQTLYEDYPSLGTNTYWEDTGNLHSFPVVNHPRDDAMRFYRVIKTDTNDPVNAPQVSILSPSGGSELTGDVTVTASVNSPLSVDTLRFFVDGAEVEFTDDSGTNFVLNTCQFANGTHKIFAVAASSSGAESTDDTNSNDEEEHLGVSGEVTVTFNNLITDFNEQVRFIDPTLSETNRFMANFALYADWTLILTNDSGVTVRTVAGTGYGMVFFWDGTGDGGVTLPAGPYGAVLTAAQSSSPPPSAPEISTPMSEALAAGKTSYFVESPPMPPVKTNGVWVPWEEVYGPLPLIEVQIPQSVLEADSTSQSTTLAGPTGNGPLDGPTPTSQTTVLRPIPPAWFGSRGTIGLGWQGNHPNNLWPANTAPDDGLFGTIQLNTRSPAGAYGPLKSVRHISYSFSQFMDRFGYRTKVSKWDRYLNATDLRGPTYGGNGIFDQVNFGFLVGHGVYGFDPDFTISFDGPLQSYFPVYTGAVGYDWVRLSEFEFGRPGSNLRWMSILNCNNLVDSVYQDCWDKEALPVGDNLHLFCGARTAIFMVSNFGNKYAGALTGHGTTRRTIMDSWFFAGTQTQGRQPGGPHIPVTFRVIGWPNCFNDDLVNYQDPNSGNPGDIEFRDSTVFNYP